METNIEEVSAVRVESPAAPTLAPAPEVPRAAAVVIEGKSQAEIDLEARLTKVNETVKGHELTIAQLREETHQLRRVQPTPRKKKSPLEAFFDGED